MTDQNGQPVADLVAGAERLRGELQATFEQPALELRARLEEYRGRVQLVLDDVNEQLRLVNAVLRPFAPKETTKETRRRGQTPGMRKLSNAQRVQKVRDYIDQHRDELGAFTATSLYRMMREDGGSPGASVVAEIVKDLHAQGFLVAVRRTVGGGVEYRPTSTVAA